MNPNESLRSIILPFYTHTHEHMRNNSPAAKGV